jgi:hypothetical protein
MSATPRGGLRQQGRRKALTSVLASRKQPSTSSSRSANDMKMDLQKRKRRIHDEAFKRTVVEHALRLPAGSRIKPTCKIYQDIIPVRLLI